MAPGYLGTEVLVGKLTKILFKLIKNFLPEIIKEINNKIKDCEEAIHHLGQPLPVDNSGKLNLLWNMLSEYCDTFRNVLKGKYDLKKHSYIKDEGGYKIKALYKELITDFTGDYKATAGYKDDYINEALIIHEGDSIPGFPSVDAFIYLLKPELEKLRDPISDCLAEVFSYLEMLSSKILEKTFMRFPRLIDSVNDFVSSFLNEQRDKAKYIVDSVVDMEINYLFTNDQEYLCNYHNILPKNSEKQQQEKNVKFKI
jgi:dynamin 1-like protein